MKHARIHWIVLAMFAMMIAISGCSSSKNEIIEGKINVATSFYPLYEIVKEIGGEQVNAMNLVPSGVEPHEWSPKSSDMKNITKAQMFVYNGAGLEGWVDNFLDGLRKDSKLVIVEASLGIKLIEAGREEEHEETHRESADGHQHGQYDPHVWVSPLQYMKMAENVKEALIRMDGDHEQDYNDRFQRFTNKLDELSEKFRAVVADAAREDIVVSHGAFGYLARDFGFNQVSIMGLSPEAEPTAQEIKSISQFIKNHKVKYILFEELVSPKLAKMMADDLNIETLVFNPVEGLTDEQRAKGESYFTIMESNLTSLEKALQ